MGWVCGIFSWGLLYCYILYEGYTTSSAQPVDITLNHLPAEHPRYAPAYLSGTVFGFGPPTVQCATDTQYCLFWSPLPVINGGGKMASTGSKCVFYPPQKPAWPTPTLERVESIKAKVVRANRSVMYNKRRKSPVGETWSSRTMSSTDACE